MASHPPHQEPLINDLAMLEDALGRMFAALGHQCEWDEVKSLAQASLSTPASAPKSKTTLRPDEMRLRVRMLSHLFFASNVAEQAHRIRRRRAHRQPDETPQKGGLIDVLTRLKQKNIPEAIVCDVIGSLEISSVLTAHPTEPSRRTLLRKEARLLRHLLASSESVALADEAEHRKEAMMRELALAWLTDELPSAPSVANEAEHVIFHLAGTLYDVVPAISEGVANAFEKTFGSRLGDDVVAKAIVKFGSWVGGDMDGNPNVGAETILESLTQQRRALIANYRRELLRLLDAYSQSDVHDVCAENVCKRLVVCASLNPELKVPERHRAMPYRQLLHHMIARLDGIEHNAPWAYVDAQNLRDDLVALRNDVASLAPKLHVERPIARLLRRVETFGLHLATLDVRQDALVHREAVGALLGDENFVNLAIFERTERIEKALAGLTVHCATDGVVASEPLAPLPRSLGVMRAIKAARERFGRAAIGPYIISMAKDIDDVLATMLLAKSAGLLDAQGEVDLDISPLFETVPDLERAGATLAAMLEHPIYRAHLRARKDTQHVMLGYSDSNKASGIAASRWALQQAQRALSAVAENFGIKLILFHGRGGTTSRGASRPREAIFALPVGVTRGELRETVQGESIHHNFGHEQLALRSLELQGGAVLERLAQSAEPLTKPAYFEAMALCAGVSQKAYQSLVAHPDFFAFFTAATPIDAIGQLKIGSRPSARRTQKSLGDLRAIPWVFSWTQSRMLIPSWFGLGQGLRAMREAFGIDVLREMRHRWPFFATLLRDAAAGLGIVDLEVAEMYTTLAGSSACAVWRQIKEAFVQSAEELLLVVEQDHLLAHEPVLRHALMRRNPWIRPLHELQVSLLAQWRSAARQDEELKRALLLSVKGIARGLASTG